MTVARTALAALGLAAVAAVPIAAAPTVVADIAATHSIVARVMEGVGEPGLLLPPGASPHVYTLRPSEAAALDSADLVFWIGAAYTPWLADPIETLAADAHQVAYQEAPGVTLLPVRAGGPFESDPHQHEDEHGHDDHQDHPDHGEAHSEPAAGATDGHLWLDPLNAAAMARATAGALAEIDPENEGQYRSNAETFAQEMDALVAEVGASLAPARGRPFVVFHDAYQYFEARFDLPASGSIALHDADQPSPARMAAIRERIRDDGVVCVFAEPQFPAALIETAIEGTDARHGSLDPVGAAIEPGPDFYPALIRGLARDLLACLEQE